LIALLNTFHGLTLPEIESLLRICSYRSYEQAQRVYALDDTSDELLILLSGRLSIRSEAGDALANIEPGAPVARWVSSPSSPVRPASSRWKPPTD